MCASGFSCKTLWSNRQLASTPHGHWNPTKLPVLDAFHMGLRAQNELIQWPISPFPGGDLTKAHPQCDHLVRFPGQSAQGHSARHEAAANGDGIFLAPVPTTGVSKGSKGLGASVGISVGCSPACRFILTRPRYSSERAPFS